MDTSATLVPNDGRSDVASDCLIHRRVPNGTTKVPLPERRKEFRYMMDPLLQEKRRREEITGGSRTKDIRSNVIMWQSSFSSKILIDWLIMRPLFLHLGGSSLIAP